MKSGKLIGYELLTVAALVAAAAAGCGGQQPPDGATRLIEETGTIISQDTRDPNHMNFPYDSYEFSVERGDRVRVEAEADGFHYLLKLMEISTGAVTAEWDPAYPGGEDALTYTIAGGGMYEARIYAMENGTGSYAITISVSAGETD